METNARLVTWSDGSTHLLVGGEALAVAEADCAADRAAAYARHATMMQCRAPLDARLAFTPASVTSAAHRRLAATVGSRHERASRVRTTATVVDPAKQKAEREREEEGASSSSKIKRPCCNPSKFESIDILHLDEMDPTRLKVTHWKNIIVSECACA